MVRICPAKGTNSAGDGYHTQLNPRCLDAFRFYSNAVDRGFEEFGKTSQLSERVLRLVLSSKRVFVQLLGVDCSGTIFVLRSSFYLKGTCGVNYYTPNILLAARLIQAGDFPKRKRAIYVSPGEGLVKAEKAIVRLIYFARKARLNLVLAEEFQTRLAVQVITDLDTRVTGFGDEPLVQHYAVNQHKLEDHDEAGCTVRLVNEIGKARRDELNQAARRLPELLATQKKVLVRQPYLNDVFLPCLTALNLKGFDFLTIYQYFPLPSMENLTDLQASLRLLDVGDYTIDVFGQICDEVSRVAPKAAIHISVEVTMNSRTYQGHVRAMMNLTCRLELLCHHIALIPTPIVCLRASINTHLPLAEQTHKAEWPDLVRGLNLFYKVSFGPNHWCYTPNYPAPPRYQGRQRFNIGIHARFTDEVLVALGEKQLEIFE